MKILVTLLVISLVVACGSSSSSSSPLSACSYASTLSLGSVKNPKVYPCKGVACPGGACVPFECPDSVAVSLSACQDPGLPFAIPKGETVLCCPPGAM